MSNQKTELTHQQRIKKRSNGVKRHGDSRLSSENYEETKGGREKSYKGVRLTIGPLTSQIASLVQCFHMTR